MSVDQPVANPAGNTSTNGAAPEIRVVGLHKSFNHNHVLRDVNVQIRRGELVAVVGGSGSGKTVLVQHIIGHLQPDKGKVLVADHEARGAPLVDLADLDEAGMDRLRRHWGVVFQHNALFSGTVFYNISLGLREVKAMTDERQILRRAQQVLQAVGLEPQKVMDVDRDELSGGMAKRVGIARALALDPLLLFYDEPTTGLDPQVSEQIHELIRSGHERKSDTGDPRTTVIITHDKDLLARLSPRIIMLHEGKVFFDGTYDQFANSDSDVIRPYFVSLPALHRLERRSAGSEGTYKPR
jgi:phospholipid/cholesterol/gamma-HCH transport system ATP-binding protein